MHSDERLRVRPLTVILVVVAAACVLAGIVYIQTPANRLPAFLPGHSPRPVRHQVGDALVMFVLAAAAWLGACRTTASLS
jgi:hypothetical protein